jgi:hypothetical protein
VHYYGYLSPLFFSDSQISWSKACSINSLVN